MEERQVTVDGVTYPLESPFMVIATQNPIEMEGTYPLPEAQRDRFTARISIGYPDPVAEAAMLDTYGSSSPLDDLQPAAHATDVRALIAAVREVHVAKQVRQYIIDIIVATRNASALRLGAAPLAALEDRSFVIPDDVQALAGSVLAHRLLPTAEAVVGRELPEQVLARIIERVPLPGR
jgi:MoxR-like ATPase